MKNCVERKSLTMSQQMAYHLSNYFFYTFTAFCSAGGGFVNPQLTFW